MNLWIPSFKSTKLEFSRIFCFRATKGIKHKSHFCQAQPQLQLSQVSAVLGWESIIFDFPPPPPHPPRESTVEDISSLWSHPWLFTSGPVPFDNATFVHTTYVHATFVHATSVRATFSIQHLSRDKIWLFTIATAPVWTKHSNLKLATEPNQNLANSS